MSEIIALTVHIIDVKDNFVHLHNKYLNKFRNSRSELGCVKIKANQTSYASCSGTPFNSNGENAFNISTTFTKTLGINEFDTVIISNLSLVPSLRTVLVSPMSQNDLSILEDKAEAIQATWLNQIRIVVKDQILTVWVSKSVSVQIHVDRLDNDLSYGKLEEHTEVEVSLNIYNSSSEAEHETKVDSTWDVFKNIFSFGKNAHNTSTEEETNELKFISEGVYRCILIDDDVFKFEKHIQNYPYNAFVASWYRKNKKKNSYSICRLTHLPYISTTKLHQTSEKTDVLSSKQIFIHLYEIDEANIVDELAYAKVNNYPTIFVSKSVFLSLGMKLNSKVKLESVMNESKFKPTQIDVTVVEANMEEVNLIQGIKNLFQAPLVEGIINNGHLFVLNSENVLYLSFNPVSLPFVELSEVDTNIFCVTQRKLDLKIKDAESEIKLIPLNFQEEIISQLKISLLLRLRLLRRPRDDDLENSNHIIIEGDTGTGKSSIVALLSEEFARKGSYHIFVKRLECKTWKGKLISKLEKLLQAALLECLHYEPAVLCLDDLDVLFTSSKQNMQQKHDTTSSSYTNRLSHLIYDLVHEYSKHHVTVLATATNFSALEPKLVQARGTCLFSNRLRLPTMDQEMRRECLNQFMSNRVDLFSNVAENVDQVTELVRQSEGYCVQDLSDLVDRLYFEKIKRQFGAASCDGACQVTEGDVHEALASIVPLSLVGIELHKGSSVSWMDVGGLNAAKKVLTEVLIWPSQFPKIFEQCPLKMPSGVLLYGVPGSGKTLLARAIAGESGLNFISIKGPELLSKFVGESEEGVRNTFRKAQNAKPCILFFDEFDSLAPRRGNDITGVTDRVVNQLLTELDGVEAVSGVWVLAATSRPDLIDPALLRPGRLGTTVYCPFPNEEERYSILKVMRDDLANVDAQVDWKAIAAVTAGYTGADLKAVLYTAATLCDTARLQEVKACLRREDESTGAVEQDVKVSIKKIDTDCLLKAVQETTPSLKREQMLSYEMIYKQFEQRDDKIQLPKEQKVTLA